MAEARAFDGQVFDDIKSIRSLAPWSARAVIERDLESFGDGSLAEALAVQAHDLGTDGGGRRFFHPPTQSSPATQRRNFSP